MRRPSSVGQLCYPSAFCQLSCRCEFSLQWVQLRGANQSEPICFVFWLIKENTKWCSTFFFKYDPKQIDECTFEHRSCAVEYCAPKHSQDMQCLVSACAIWQDACWPIRIGVGVISISKTSTIIVDYSLLFFFFFSFLQYTLALVHFVCSR